MSLYLGTTKITPIISVGDTKAEEQKQVSYTANGNYNVEPTSSDKVMTKVAISVDVPTIITLDTATEMDAVLEDTTNAGKLYEISSSSGDYIAGVIYKAEE